MNAILPAPAGKLDERLPLIAVRVAVMTISDTRDEESRHLRRNPRRPCGRQRP